MTRTNTWMIERHAGDQFDLSRNGRRLLVGVPLSEIRRYLKKNQLPGDKAYWEEEDGYLTAFR